MGNNKKILFISNPVAGRQKSKTALFDIVNTFCKHDYDVTVKITQHRGHARQLAYTAKEDGYDIVACIGGDGTMNECASGIVESGSGLPLGYIPAGSTNDFADNLSLSVIPAIAAEQITNEKPFVLDIGKFNEDRYFTYIASFGAFTDASYSAPQDLKNTLGPLAYLMEGIKDLAHIKPHKIRTIADGVEYNGSYIFGAICNTKRMAGIFHLDVTNEDLMDGKFEVLLVKYPKSIGELNQIVSGITSKDYSSKLFDYFEASDIELFTAKTLDWTLDGEKAEGNGYVHIINLETALTLYK